MFATAVLFLAALSVANAGVVMESALLDRRDDFQKNGYPAPSTTHEVVFAVKQLNMDKLESILFSVSDPKSKDYGNFLTREQVGNLTSNSFGTESIRKYLTDAGAKITKVTPYGEYITAVGTVELWEKMFDTKFYNFRHVEDVLPNIIRAVHYSLPSELVNHVFAAFNTVQFPPQKPFKKLLSVKDESGKSSTVTPSLLNSYYDITSNKGSAKASQSVLEGLDQYYSPDDLTTFQKSFNLPVDAVDEVIGGHESDAQCSSNANNCAEANLDVQYMMAVSQLTPTTYWYEDALDFFLAWIQEVAAMENPPLVHSISYGSIETSLPASIGSSFNTEAMKLGAQGVSILVSSGDDGVANFNARNSAKNCGYEPSFPASSPYVTAVGATQGPESGTEEIACSAATDGVITTGGGFSTLFDALDYQKDTVSAYFGGLSRSEEPASGYNANGRGYPDVSMAGYNYEVTIGGKTYLLSGTSASAPVVAAMVSLVNAARLEAGKSPLGLLNSAIYQSGTAFSNDVVTGDNTCTASKVCCDEGFYTTKGWDPVTGFGSVNYSKFYDVFYNL